MGGRAQRELSGRRTERRLTSSRWSRCSKVAGGESLSVGVVIDPPMRRRQCENTIWLFKRSAVKFVATFDLRFQNSEWNGPEIHAKFCCQLSPRSEVETYVIRGCHASGGSSLHPSVCLFVCPRAEQTDSFHQPLLSLTVTQIERRATEDQLRGGRTFF